MTEHDDPLIQGVPLSSWEWYMGNFAKPGDPPLRGIRVEPDSLERVMTWREYLPTDPFIGLHQSGPRMGARVTMADLGWRHDEQRGREGV